MNFFKLSPSSSASSALPRAAMLALLPWACMLGFGPSAAAAEPPATTTAEAPAAPVVPDPAALEALGGRPGLGLLATDFVDRLIADPRTGTFFKGVKTVPLAEKLADQFCVVLGGPCSYKGAPMRLSHEGMEIRKQDFNALVEVLQQTMDARGIAFSVQNRLLARLAPMHRDIINTPSAEQASAK
jgi:hemoglobin